MKLVKLGLASVLAVGLSTSATGYAGTDVQIMGALGLGSPKLTKLGKAHSKKFKEHYAKYQEEHQKLLFAEKGEDEKKARSQYIDACHAIIANHKGRSAEDVAADKKTKEDFEKSDNYKKYLKDNEKNLQELHKKTGEKFENHHDAHEYHESLKDANQEKELSGLGFGGGAEVSVRFEVADSVHVGPYIAYNYLYGSYEEKDAKESDSDKKDDKKKEEKSDKDDKEEKSDKSKKSEKFKLSHHIASFGGFATWKINDSFSVKGQIGLAGVWRNLTHHDVEKEIGGGKFALALGVNGTWHINSTFGVILGVKGYMIFAGDAKEESESDDKDDKKKKKSDESNSEEGENKKKDESSSSSKVDHHLASSIFEISLGLVMNVH